MTPLTNFAEGTPEFRYNAALCKARNVVERLFGVLKATWRCLSRQRALMYNPGFAGKIVNACCVLHNLRLGQPDFSPEGMDFPEIFDGNNGDDAASEPTPLSSNPLLSVAKRIQNRIINSYYAN